MPGTRSTAKKTARPLVSCVMPTRDRPRFAGLAIEYFLRQDYQPRELVIVDDGDKPISDLVPASREVRYFRLDEKTPLGAKRNLACERARGEIILHWDDDDWHAPDRVSRMVKGLARRRAEVCGQSHVLCYDLGSEAGWLWRDPAGICGGSLCYRRNYWNVHRFAETDADEAAEFLRGAESERVAALRDRKLLIAMLHGRNAVLEAPGGPGWKPFPAAGIRRILGEDWNFYEPELALASREDLSRPMVSCIMPTRNRRHFVPLAIHYFERQDYEPRELIILDDGDDPVEDLIPRDERIRYVRIEGKLSVGAKRNLGCEQARGQVILHWDDDDWQAPRRIRYMVEGLLKERAEVCGLNPVFFFDARCGQAWLYRYPPEVRFWVYGSSLCYRRTFWERNRFADIDVGEDNLFVWNAPPARMAALRDSSCLVCLIHETNVSPKQVDTSYWHPHPMGDVRRILGEDWSFYEPQIGCALPPPPPQPEPAPPPAVLSFPAPETAGLRNIFACLVHENPECVVDLVRNLRCLDPSSVVLLYDGGGQLLNAAFPFERYGAVVHPSPRTMAWGQLHGFALDAMEFALAHFQFDTFTIVDSDQLAVRAGYSRHIEPCVAAHDKLGMLVNSPAPQPPDTSVGPAAAAFREIGLWRPYLRRFADGERKFVHWSYWPSTVFTADAARDLVKLFRTDAGLADILQRSRIWATEEVLFPTLAALLGYEIRANPCSYDYVKYREPYSTRQIEVALLRPDVYWVHPVIRKYEDPLRRMIRERHQQYQRPAAAASTNGSAPPVLLATQPILARMRPIEGWLDEDEADLLIAAVSRALALFPGPRDLIEVGSYCGRSTVVIGSVIQAVSPDSRLHAIDPHDGKIGSLDLGLGTEAPTFTRFQQNVSAAGLWGVVDAIQKPSYEVAWDRPVPFLFIDGLHDYPNVSRDFYHFERFVVPGGLIAFHDYADFFPGVKCLVDELAASGRYRKLGLARSMMVVEKLG